MVRFRTSASVLFYKVPSPSPIYPGGIHSFFLAGKVAGGVKMMFHLHPVLSSTTIKSYLHAPMCLQWVFAESFTFHLFLGSQNILNLQAVRMPKKWKYQTLWIDAINCYYTRALEVSSQKINPKKRKIFLLRYKRVWFKKMDSISCVYISWTIHRMWMIYTTFERGGPKFSNTTARALA